MAWIIKDRNPLSERTIHTDRLDVHYYEAGKDDGFPVILLHEELANARWWSGMQQIFPFRYHTYAPDLRGHGGSTGNPNIRASLQDYSEDVAAFAQALNLTEFFVVGWGIGGIIAMQFIHDHSESLSGVAFINAMLPEAGKHNPYADDKFRRLARFLYDRNAYDAGRSLRESFFFDGNYPIGNLKSDGSLHGTGDHLDAEVFEYLLEGSLGQHGNMGDENHELYQSIQGLDAPAIVHDFPKPILVLFSRDDAIVERKYSAELVTATNPDGDYRREQYEMILIGHSPMVEELDAFADNLAGWLGRYTTDQINYSASALS